MRPSIKCKRTPKKYYLLMLDRFFGRLKTIMPFSYYMAPLPLNRSNKGEYQSICICPFIHTLPTDFLFVDSNCYTVGAVCCCYFFQFFHYIALAHFQCTLNICVTPKCLYGVYHALNLTVTFTDCNRFRF